MKEPVPFTQSVVQNVFIAVGQFAVNWSLMEFSLDAMIATIFHELGGKKLEPELPRELKRKLEFLRANLAKNEAVAPVREALTPLLNQISNLKRTRHDIVHGYLSSYDQTGHTLTFVSLDRDAQKIFHIVRERKITAFDLLKVGVEAGQLGHDLGQVTIQLFNIAGIKNKLGDTLRKL